MPAYRPNKDYCDRNDFQYPAPDHVWVPENFTFAALKNTLFDMVAEDTHFINTETMGAMATHDGINGERLAALVVPVRFSPGNAAKIADVLGELSADLGRHVPATFVFYNEATTYDVNAQSTQSVQDDLRNKGYHVVVEDAELNAPLDFLPSVPTDNTTVIQTMEGVYTGGHPLEDFAKNPKARLAVIELADHAFSDSPKFPTTRMADLPEVRRNDASALNRYFDEKPAPLGHRTTIEPLGELALSQGRHGFNPQRHEMS